MLVKNMYVNNRRFSIILKDFVLYTDAHADKILTLPFLLFWTCICRHFLLCLYGAVAIALVLAGRLKELRVIDILTGALTTPLNVIGAQLHVRPKVIVVFLC